MFTPSWGLLCWSKATSQHIVLELNLLLNPSFPCLLTLAVMSEVSLVHVVAQFVAKSLLPLC